jgi:pre-mRNA cleavage complex 2 protein Pcf11
VVKNVGTPYTLFFGRNLYQTFMNAYALVDAPIRRKLEEMLKTWKEPVPGSLDTRPVFPPEVTRDIENALIKARTAALQTQQQHARTQQQLLSRNRATPQPPYRNTPTPPNGASRSHPPQNFNGQYPSNGTAQPYASQQVC